MAEGAACRRCTIGTVFYDHTGFLICNECGEYQGEFQEENEFRAGIDDARGRRRAAGSTANQQTQAQTLARDEQVAAERLKLAALAYVRCLQQLLQEQAECLVTRFGVSSQVSSVLRQLWLSHIPHTGMLEPMPRQPAAGTSAAADAADADAADSDDGDGVQPSAAAGQAGTDNLRSTDLAEAPNMQRLFWKLLHPQVTVQLCFLACVLLREAVTCYDIISWALDGQLPYLCLPDVGSQCLSERESLALHIRCLQASVTTSPTCLLNRVCSIAAHLNLELPQIAGEALLLREVQELGLPQVALDVALQLYFLHLIRTPRLALVPMGKSRTQAMPYVWLSAVLLVALKLCYGLGSASGTAAVVPRAPEPPGGWHTWAQAAMQRLPGLSSMLLSEQEVLGLDPAAQQQYLQFCRVTMFAGNPVLHHMEDVQKLLTGWYEAAAGQEAAAVAAQTQPVAPGTQGAGAPSASEQRSSQRAGSRLSSVAGSAAGAAAYTLTLQGSAATGTSQMFKMEPQMAAVVLVLSAYSRCSPAVLLDSVKAIEKQMVSVEAGIKMLQQMG